MRASLEVRHRPPHGVRGEQGAERATGRELLEQIARARDQKPASQQIRRRSKHRLVASEEDVRADRHSLFDEIAIPAGRNRTERPSKGARVGHIRRRRRTPVVAPSVER